MAKKGRCEACKSVTTKLIVPLGWYHYDYTFGWYNYDCTCDIEEVKKEEMEVSLKS